MNVIANTIWNFINYSGPPGKPGKPGLQGPRGQKGESGGVTGGAVYTRWGRDDCPNTTNSTQLYSGKKLTIFSQHNDRELFIRTDNYPELTGLQWISSLYLKFDLHNVMNIYPFICNIYNMNGRSVWNLQGEP